MRYEFNDRLPLALGAKATTPDEAIERMDAAIARLREQYRKLLEGEQLVKWVDPQLAGMPSDMRHPAAPKTPAASPKFTGRLRAPSYIAEARARLGEEWCKANEIGWRDTGMAPPADLVKAIPVGRAELVGRAWVITYEDGRVVTHEIGAPVGQT